MPKTQKPDLESEWVQSLEGGAHGLPLSSHNVCFTDLVDQIPTAVYAIDALGFVTYYNRAAAELAGRRPQIGSDRWCVSWKLYRADGSPIADDECHMARALKELREIRGAEAIIERPDGSRRWVEPYPTILYDDAGKVIGAVNVVVDITDRRRSADILIEMDRRKNEFLAQLGHELRNPLAAARNSIDAFFHRAEPHAQEYAELVLSMVDRQVSHLVRLVDDLLEVSRITNGKIELKKEIVELADLLRHAIETAQPTIKLAQHDLRIELPDDPLMLDADPVRLAEVFTNLLNNSAKYTEPGGVIRVSAERRGKEAIITIRDSGVGISAEMLPRVFELFTQVEGTIGRAQGGLGIGLALVKTLVELHGGTVEAQSDGLGCGSAFVVRLPAITRKVGGTAVQKQGPDELHSARRVLVIDDDKDVGDSLAMLLQTIGVGVRTTYSGAEGLDELRAFRPTLVFLDLGMPQMDGYETARRIRALPEGREVMLVALTGWGQEQVGDRARDAGFDCQLTKPVGFKELQGFLKP